MLQLKDQPNSNNKAHRKKRPNNNKGNTNPHKRIASMGRISANIIDELYNPIDATNRFINLALQSLEEDSQSRQFLIESKQGIRKTSVLLKRLNNYVKKIEKEIRKISIVNE